MKQGGLAEDREARQKKELKLEFGRSINVKRERKVRGMGAHIESRTTVNANQLPA